MDVPEDLIEIQRAFQAAVARSAEISAAFPSSADVAEGPAEITDEQRAVSRAARAESARLAKELRNHPWWAEVSDHAEARKALWDAVAA